MSSGLPVLTLGSCRATLLPVTPDDPGLASFARDLLLQQRKDALVLDLPPFLLAPLTRAVEALPDLRVAVVEVSDDSPLRLLAADPADPRAAALDVCLQERIPVVAADSSSRIPSPSPPLPGDAERRVLGNELWWNLLMTQVTPDPRESLRAKAVHRTLLNLRGDVLAVVSTGVALALMRGDLDSQDAHDGEAPRLLDEAPLHPDHALSVLGVPPFAAARILTARADPSAASPLSDDWPALALSYARRRFLARDDARRLPPGLLSVTLRLARRLTRARGLLRLGPWELITAARGTGGDSFALALAGTLRHWGLGDPPGPDALRPDLLTLRMARGLPARPWLPWFHLEGRTWTSISLRPKPSRREREAWRRAGTGSSLCSHLPEDTAIERFHREVAARAAERGRVGSPRSVPFGASLLDGLDLRETLRQVGRGGLWVREQPQREVLVQSVVLLFDTEHDSRYPHRGTWYAEHAQESNLLFYATNPMDHPVGPGIARSLYGGLALLFPPEPIPDIFDVSLPPQVHDCASRLLWGACHLTRSPVVAVACEGALHASWRALAREAGRRLIHVPLESFSASRLQRLRTFHVLRGRHVRGWAHKFIHGD